MAAPEPFDVDNRLSKGGRASVFSSLRELFTAVPLEPYPAVQFPLAMFLDAIRCATDKLVAQDRACIERSKEAVTQSLELLGRSGRSPVVLGERSVPLHADLVDSLTEAQWIVCFCLELGTLTPHLTETRAFLLAAELRARAPHIDPKLAAISMAAGLRGAAFS